MTEREKGRIEGLQEAEKECRLEASRGGTGDYQLACRYLAEFCAERVNTLIGSR